MCAVNVFAIYVPTYVCTHLQNAQANTHHNTSAGDSFASFSMWSKFKASSSSAHVHTSCCNLSNPLPMLCVGLPWMCVVLLFHVSHSDVWFFYS